MAAPLPDQHAQRVLRALQPLRRRHPEARWMPAEMLHLTLVFLGATDPTRRSSIEAAVAAVVARHAPFSVGTGAAGGRADGGRGGVGWLGLADGREAVARLSRDLDVAIGSRVYATAPPRPHLTVARRVDAALLADLQRSSAEFACAWPVDAVVVYRSHTGPAGSHYEELARRPLTGRIASA